MEKNVRGRMLVSIFCCIEWYFKYNIWEKKEKSKIYKKLAELWIIENSD